MAKIAIVYYSSTGNTYRLAQAAVEGARSTGAEVRLRRCAELAPAAAIDSNPAWRKHHDATQDIELATPDDVEWADGFLFGSPTRFGLPTSQLKQFIDLCGGKWAAGKLQDKAAGAFTGAANEHGGQESTLLAIQNVFYHWGAIIVPVGYTDPLLYAAGGNPYGVSYTDKRDGKTPEEKLVAARYQGRRVALYADIIARNRDALTAKEKVSAAPA